ncbi:hypothetical protein V8C43DRAFT_299619 [Trichoderma afarasin]|uniref:Ecp2 effector protein domain-containing protein n=3 Tax=Trichoderma TaxID=5543 RepID=A0A9W9B3B6_9HYPO|nr:uncharacterized protein T069G_10688 [Trichoderma breve]KAF3076245.1 hypothetical protein CFAM422_001319 [Trichoderma lentiforme]KAJ4855130.1 hypothetical protein T069G_10688 [Trichoderma breve]OPB46888.1 hypothetical protein A0O28_0070120 [Trichoderma guizhouense]
MRSSVYAALFSLVAVGLAVECHPKVDPIPTFSLSDGRNLQNDIHGNQFNPPLNFPLTIDPAHTASFSVGSAIACIENAYSFESTKIGQTDLANAIQAIMDECDHGNGVTKGGKVDIIGDNGLPLEVLIQDRALGCEN